MAFVMILLMGDSTMPTAPSIGAQCHQSPLAAFWAR
jgi:hypothetical protein